MSHFRTGWPCSISRPTLLNRDRLVPSGLRRIRVFKATDVVDQHKHIVPSHPEHLLGHAIRRPLRLHSHQPSAPASRTGQANPQAVALETSGLR